MKSKNMQFLTGEEWGKHFEMQFVNYDGWFSKDEFFKEKVSKFEFLNRASQCVIIPPSQKTRREAGKYKEKLLKPLNNDK